MIRMVYGTGVVVVPLDIPPGDSTGRDKASSFTVVKNFEESLANAGEFYKATAQGYNARDSIAVDQQLEIELEKIFAKYPKLKERHRGPLTLFMSRGADHEVSFDTKLRRQGVAVENVSIQERHLYISSLVNNKYIMGKEPTRDELAKALMEELTLHILESSGINFNDTNKYLHYSAIVTSHFDIDEIAKVHNLLMTSRLNFNILTTIFSRKGLGPLPTNDAQLDEAIAALSQKEQE
jgi:hypothetical protein